MSISRQFFSILTYLLLATYCHVALSEEDIAYLRLTDGYWQVWVTDSQGKNHRQITHDAIDKTSMSWSPNRELLLCNKNDGTLVRVSVTDGKQQMVSLPLSGMLDAQWSPDGRSVAFSYNSLPSGDNIDIWTIGIDGKQQRKLTNQPGVELSPSWSADSRRLVYTAGSAGSVGKAGKVPQLWVLDVQINTQTQLTADAANKFDPAFSASDEIAYTSNTQGNYDIWRMAADGSGNVSVTDNPAYDAQPSWSLDSSQIAFYSLRGGARRIWVTDVAQETSWPITPGDVDSRLPVWTN